MNKSSKTFKRKVTASLRRSLLIAEDCQSVDKEVPRVSSSTAIKRRFRINRPRIHVSNLDYLSDNFIESEINSPVKSLRDQLSEWAIKFKVKHEALTSLLKLLRSRGNNDLPQDARTLLNTPRSIQVCSLDPGQYYHAGLKRQLDIIGKTLTVIPNNFELQISVDGLPLSKSTSLQFWPILGCIQNLKELKPFLIGIYCGDGKPSSSNEFLRAFVDESAELQESGLECGSQKVSVSVSSFVCDAPARAFILNVKGHNGYFGCGKCIQEGDVIGHRTVFLDTASTLRTNESFREQRQPEHHHSVSALTRLSCDLVQDIPFEFMHLVCLGVTRKLLNLWTRGKAGPYKLSASQIHSISSELIKLKQHVPSEFSRKPRSLSFLPRWKATEFRQFVLYSGPRVLKSVLSRDYYTHFMSFHVAIYILCSNSLYMRLNEYADQLLIYFVQEFPVLYGPEQVSYNIHGLCHLAKDSLRHGPLDFYSAFKFENYLGEIKLMLRSSFRPLAQVIHRLEEKIQVSAKDEQINCSKPRAVLPLKNSDADGKLYYSAVQFPKFILKSKTGDQFFVLKNGTIGKFMKCRPCDAGKVVILYKICDRIDSVYNLPCDSTKLGIVQAQLDETAFEMSFCVVEFTGRGEMLVVNSRWLTLEGQIYCPPYWANSTKLKKAIKNAEAPNPTTWKLYDCRVLHRSGSLDEAFRAMKSAETSKTSDIGLEVPLGRGFRKGNVTKRVSEHETSDDDQHTPKMPQKKTKGRTRLFSTKNLIRTPPNFPQSEGADCAVGDNLLVPATPVSGHEISQGLEEIFDNDPNGLLELTDSVFGSLGNEPRKSPLIPTHESQASTQNSGILGQILKKLAVINAKMDDQSDMIAALVSSQNKRPADNSDVVDDLDLPFESTSDLQAMEAIMANDKAARTHLTAALAKAGGSNVNDTTYRTLERLMTNDVALSFSWAGISGKQPFKNLVVMKVVRDAVKKNPMAKNPTDFEIEKAIKYWLKRANSRISVAVGSTQHQE